MKPALVALSLFVYSPSLLPYGSFVSKEPGNPNWNRYAGAEGSTYDAKENPAQTVGMVHYNPMAPLPPVAPATPSGSGMSGR